MLCFDLSQRASLLCAFFAPSVLVSQEVRTEMQFVMDAASKDFAQMRIPFLWLLQIQLRNPYNAVLKFLSCIPAWNGFSGLLEQPQVFATLVSASALDQGEAFCIGMYSLK